MTAGLVSRMLFAMKATSTTTHCHTCSALVECAQHLPLCDRCLDARLAQLERGLGRPPRRSGALRWPAAALADGWRGGANARDVPSLAA
jgi:hypothetical protein